MFENHGDVELVDVGSGRGGGWAWGSDRSFPTLFYDCTKNHGCFFQEHKKGIFHTCTSVDFQLMQNAERKL